MYIDLMYSVCIFITLDNCTFVWMISVSEMSFTELVFINYLLTIHTFLDVEYMEWVVYHWLTPSQVLATNSCVHVCVFVCGPLL